MASERPLQQAEKQLLRLLCPAFQGWHSLGYLCPNIGSCVPRMVDACNELTYPDGAKRRSRHFEVFEQARDPRRIRQSGERRATQRGEDAEMESHADCEFKSTHDVQNLMRRVSTSEEFGSLRVFSCRPPPHDYAHVSLFH